MCTIASKINGTPKGVCLPISKLHSILAVANLLAHNNKSQICWQSDTFGGNIYFAAYGTWDLYPFNFFLLPTLHLLAHIYIYIYIYIYICSPVHVTLVLRHSSASWYSLGTLSMSNHQPWYCKTITLLLTK